ncbi:MAG: pyrroloquinoline quinone biosynthesis protein PqqB [Hyphomicrobium zavarzinii]|jgi:pyrroloquinoline quinone biosynthesis protein B|uniref:pyrroloquinoline quinone biosynthesis protein PqqB n=1 Tax=Hyphomicrobium zavarzinii TaxID=48292 RepID=UPI001A39149B|nr:pyrroloquinoline quinone biosynthesis protein PqqB [Hyphomicrobium zavarzinii]MBL8846653.1 pyrroloquinoline quinone biosynthesis protein PqqB [Hyphomicrobium zavarzinii]
MIIRILGAAAGGGFPQWNCNGRNSAAVRAGKPGFRPRTQCSLALSANGSDWVLLNASPDLRQQINETPALGARADGPLRNSPITAVVLTGADVDFIAGLLNLRELQPFSIYGSSRVLDTLASNSIFNVLDASVVKRNVLSFGEPTLITGAGRDTGIVVEAFPVPGKIALYLEAGSSTNNYGSREGDAIGLKITEASTGKNFFFVPGCAIVDEELAGRLKGAPLVFFDGTLYTDDEMIRQGLMQKTGARMGHMSISGSEGSIAAFEPLNVARKIYVHINNSNPVLDDNSPERRATEAAGWEVGYDGMEIHL